MHPISNVEFMLLQIIAEYRQASGYDIKKLVEQRGYREWANIGTTSIYTGLKKLSDKGWIASEKTEGKSGKGPMPTRFILTDDGINMLREEILNSLSSTRERDNRFDLGLAAMPLIGKNEALASFRKRMDFLQEVSRNIRQKYETQGGVRLPVHVRAMYLHPLSLIESEQAFLAALINELKEAAEHGHNH